MSENIIKTIAPIPIEDLKKYFVNKETQFIIDYSNSKLLGNKLLTYLSNLDIPVDIDFSNSSREEVEELLKDYLKSSALVNINSLEQITIRVLNEYKDVHLGEKIFEKFIEDNLDLIQPWISKISSLALYCLYIVELEETKNFVQTFEENDTDDLVGVNFVSLIKHEALFSLFENIKQEELKYYSKYFNNYMFKGKNLYSFWATDMNPMFLLTYGIVSGEIKPEEYFSAKQQTIQEVLADAALIR